MRWTPAIMSAAASTDLARNSSRNSRSCLLTGCLSSCRARWCSRRGRGGGRGGRSIAAGTGPREDRHRLGALVGRKAAQGVEQDQRVLALPQVAAPLLAVGGVAEVEHVVPDLECYAELASEALELCDLGV